MIRPVFIKRHSEEDSAGGRVPYCVRRVNALGLQPSLSTLSTQRHYIAVTTAPTALAKCRAIKASVRKNSKTRNCGKAELTVREMERRAGPGGDIELEEVGRHMHRGSRSQEVGTATGLMSAPNRGLPLRPWTSRFLVIGDLK
jgi:hypothetical protein